MWIPGLRRSPKGGYGNPLQYYCLENPMDREAWKAWKSMGLQGVGQDWSNFICTHRLGQLEMRKKDRERSCRNLRIVGCHKCEVLWSSVHRLILPSESL